MFTITSISIHAFDFLLHISFYLLLFQLTVQEEEVREALGHRVEVAHEDEPGGGGNKY